MNINTERAHTETRAHIYIYIYIFCSAAFRALVVRPTLHSAQTKRLTYTFFTDHQSKSTQSEAKQKQQKKPRTDHTKRARKKQQPTSHAPHIPCGEPLTECGYVRLYGGLSPDSETVWRLVANSATRNIFTYTYIYTYIYIYTGRGRSRGS